MREATGLLTVQRSQYKEWAEYEGLCYTTRVTPMSTVQYPLISLMLTVAHVASLAQQPTYQPTVGV